MGQTLVPCRQQVVPVGTTGTVGLVELPWELQMAGTPTPGSASHWLAGPQLAPGTKTVVQQAALQWYTEAAMTKGGYYFVTDSYNPYFLWFCTAYSSVILQSL